MVVPASLLLASQGARHFGGALQGSDEWIGATGASHAPVIISQATLRVCVVCGLNHSECVALLRSFGLRARVVDFFAAGAGPVPGAGAGGKKRSREGDDLAATADASCDDPAVALQRW